MMAKAATEAKPERPPLCGLSEAQVDALQAPLAQGHIRQREGKFDYIEGHHAIREANRIFGPTGWTRETVSMECVYTGEYVNRKTNATGTQVAYIAMIRIRARTEEGWVTKEGTGYGDGIDYTSPAAAHESASKEAESDAKGETPREKAMSANDMKAEVKEGKWKSQGFYKLTKRHSGDKSVEGLDALDALYRAMDLVKEFDDKLLKKVLESAKQIEEKLVAKAKAEAAAKVEAEAEVVAEDK